MKLKHLIFIFGFTFLPICHAQFEIDPGKIIDKMVGPCESDRPGQALNAKTAGLMAIQLQTGFNYGRLDDIFWKSRTYFVPVNLRFGITKKWEFNTSFSYLNNRYMADLSPDVTLKGFTSPEIGIRYAFLEGDRWTPYLALQGNMSFLSHKGDYQQQQIGSSFYLVTSNRFEVMSINTNFGIVFPGDGNITPFYPWVFNMGWMLGDKLGVFIEGFGEFASQVVSWDAGGSYMVINDLQLDLFGGMYNIINQQNAWFAEVGFTYRFSFFKMLAKKKADQLMKNGFGQ